MPVRLCADPTCPSPATYRGRCQRHARQRDKQITRAGKRIYNTKRWRVVRRSYIFNHPMCETPGCEEIATDVHHRIDLRDGGAPYDPMNLQALCRAHHSQITRKGQVTAEQ